MLIQSSFQKVEKYTSLRDGEIKLGQVLLSSKLDIRDIAELKSLILTQSAKYILVGIPEDVGIKANYGKSGAYKAFDIFLSSFVNVQQNQFLDEKNVYLLGEIYVEDIQTRSISETNIDKLRDLCAEIDERVHPVIQTIVECDKIPIIIGGGHNNSYGNIKGTSLALKKPIDVINIDPHADYRAEEGRHSGNGFHYAYRQNYINKYGVWGLHENFNNQTIIDSFSQNQNLFYESFEHLLRDPGRSFEAFLSKFSDEIGVEVDLDAIKYMPTSAKTPVGFTEEEVLNFMYKIENSKTVLYYHLTEGSPDGTNDYIVGKFLTYFVTSILKAN